MAHANPPSPSCSHSTFTHTVGLPSPARHVRIAASTRSLGTPTNAMIPSLAAASAAVHASSTLTHSIAHPISRASFAALALPNTAVASRALVAQRRRRHLDQRRVRVVVHRQLHRQRAPVSRPPSRSPVGASSRASSTSRARARRRRAPGRTPRTSRAAAPRRSSAPAARAPTRRATRRVVVRRARARRRARRAASSRACR